MGSHDALLLDLPDEILELILLSLHSPLWLHRAALTCKRWRRIIYSSGFSRRFHAFHSRRPVVAGSYYNQGDYNRPRFEPSPSAAAIHARNFSLKFLPGSNNDKCSSIIKDSRGSLLLLYREASRSGHRDLIVCEPLTRRHKVIPPPKSPIFYWSTRAVLLDGGGDGSDEEGGGGVIGMSSFRVLMCSCNGGHIRACMFTSISSSASSSWRETDIDMSSKLLHDIGFAVGRCYWHDGEKTVVALDQSALKFSSFVLPDDKYWDHRKVTLTVGRDGEARIVIDQKGNIIKIFARLKGSNTSGEEWALEKTIHVSAAMLGLRQLRYFELTCDQPEDAGMVQIRGYKGVGAPEISMRFHLDMETMEAERLPGCDMDYVRKAYQSEFPWPHDDRTI